MPFFSMLSKLFNKYFVLFLFIVVLISYGQTLGMLPWQDDNALFFKLANIEGPAGYLGKGLFGEGVYKYTAFFYYPIYFLFNHQAPFYFAYAIFFYFASALSVLITSGELFDKKVAKVVTFLYAAGFVASDGYIRLYNSVGTSLSVIFISFLLFFYFRFYKKGRAIYYFLALTAYLLAVEFVRYRTHYLIAVVILFELIFLTFRKLSVKNFFFSVLRIIPFGYVFYHYFILNSDSRSKLAVVFAQDIFGGKFYKLYGFLSSLSNTVFPDVWVNRFIDHFPNFHLGTILAGKFFANPQIIFKERELLSVCLGTLLLMAALAFIFLVKRDLRKIYILLVLWMTINVASYSAYNPLFPLETINRYLAHSFFAFVLLCGVLVLNFRNEKLGKILTLTFILLGVGNLINSIIYQNYLLKTRSLPVKEFYSRLFDYVPEIKNGDILYFDVSHEMGGVFAYAFSVAQMPETTAIAWRYGIDRYDFKMFTDFNELQREISENNIPKDKIFTLWLSNKGLVNTTQKFRDLLDTDKIQPVSCFQKEDSIVQCEKPVNSILPSKIDFEILAKPKNASQLTFSIGNKGKGVNEKLALKYGQEKRDFLKNSQYRASSYWKERTVDNLHDGDPGTVWQSDRITWENEDTNFIVKLPKVSEISRLVFLQGQGNNLPTKYKIGVSLDGKDYQWMDFSLMKNGEYYELGFSPIRTSYIKMNILGTSGGDSPQIAEAWVVSEAFSSLNLEKAEEFLGNPFTYLESFEEYQQLIRDLEGKGIVKISWMGDKSTKWLSEFDSKIEAVYDGKARTYSLIVPAGGTYIEKFAFSQETIPGEITIRRFSARPARVGIP